MKTSFLSALLLVGAIGSAAAAPVTPRATHKVTPQGVQVANTYTYLRCYYRTDADAGRTDVDYVWARDPASADYYRLYGNWRAGGMLDWDNMFYTATKQETLAAVCKSSLAVRGIAQPYAFHAAADSALSFDYSVWTLSDPAASKGFDRVVAFGDSLSDTRNMLNASLWTMPNRKSWYWGRFSNGEVWVEKLSAQLGLPLYNWAVGGAAADRQLVLPGVVQQVESWKTYMRMDSAYRPENTLFTILIGGNDLIKYGKSVDEILDAESRAIESLILAGGKHILLLNLPDVSRAPVFKSRKNGPEIAAGVLEYNRRLKVLRDGLSDKYGAMADIRLFDTYSVFGDLLDRPGAYGIDNVRDACLNIPAGASLSYLDAHPLNAFCRPDRFAFWDNLHPTRRVHEWLAAKVLPLAKSMSGG
ncbi:SGNH/GDSL hydrolase family protein [Paludibacterium paludis]|uniref:Thermolabile hemolysin n=1 Tax=Paludibacterium paludis TaxID=1225769 RepID=A0A918P4A4_9NEIS|nr:SGNH/GDSL hydrolase family protein [Paludibacterium paludis]GGY17757.1 thermolabile hemolysin [Paludibacterium paludis]